MKLTDAKNLARELMNAHGLADVPFEFNRHKRSLGVCKFRGPYKDGEYKVMGIALSEKWTPFLSEAEVKDTVLHEIAHALAGFKAAHGYKWKAMARKVGANPTRTADNVPEEVKARVGEVHAKYRATCGGCGQVYYFHRMTKGWQRGSKVCGKCRTHLTPVQLR